MSVLTEQHFPDSVVRQTKPSWQCLERGAAPRQHSQQSRNIQRKYTGSSVSESRQARTSQAPHTWSPLASLSGPHCSLMTVAILIRDTWSRGQVAVKLHRVCDQISVMGRTQPTTVCMRCCHARRPSCQSGHHCWAGAGSLPDWSVTSYQQW